MPRRIFICYEGEDRNRAKGFRLLRWNQNVDLDFFDRHLLDPVKSKDPNYIKGVIRERMHGTSCIVVIIGEHTHESEWVDWEIREAIANGKGVLGIRVKDAGDVKTPPALEEAGAEVIDWSPHEFDDAIERAIGAPAKIGGYAPGTTVSSCARTA
jgi:MTH538 TIR-like domain (DUF1863)